MAHTYNLSTGKAKEGGLPKQAWYHDSLGYSEGPCLKRKMEKHEQNPPSQKQTHIKMGSLSPFKPATKKYQPSYTTLFQKTKKKKEKERKKMVPNSFHEVTKSSQKT